MEEYALARSARIPSKLFNVRAYTRGKETWLVVPYPQRTCILCCQRKLSIFIFILIEMDLIWQMECDVHSNKTNQSDMPVENIRGVRRETDKSERMNDIEGRK